jgi:hypothetical protein
VREDKPGPEHCGRMRLVVAIMAEKRRRFLLEIWRAFLLIEIGGADKSNVV